MTQKIIRSEIIPIGTLIEIICGADSGIRLFVVCHIQDGDNMVYGLSPSGNRPICYKTDDSIRTVHKKLMLFNSETLEYGDVNVDVDTKKLVADLEKVNKILADNSPQIIRSPFLDCEYYHHKDCREEYGICDVKCPHRHYAETNNWVCYKAHYLYTIDQDEAPTLNKSVWKLIEFEYYEDSR